MNIKLSFTKNDRANFDSALTRKKSLGTSFLLYMLVAQLIIKALYSEEEGFQFKPHYVLSQAY